MTSWSPAGIAARVRWLVDTKDKGRLDVAARRLGVRPADLEHLDRWLSGDGGPKGTRLLAAVIQSYHVDACWLLTGEEELDTSTLAPDARLRLAELLLAVADALLADRARSRADGGRPEVHEPALPRGARTA